MPSLLSWPSPGAGFASHQGSACCCLPWEVAFQNGSCPGSAQSCQDSSCHPHSCPDPWTCLISNAGAKVFAWGYWSERKQLVEDHGKYGPFPALKSIPGVLLGTPEKIHVCPQCYYGSTGVGKRQSEKLWVTTSPLIVPGSPQTCSQALVQPLRERPPRGCPDFPIDGPSSVLHQCAGPAGTSPPASEQRC